MIELTIVALLNALAFWQRNKSDVSFVLFAPVACIDIIYGIMYAISGEIDSTTFYIGLAVAIIGLYCFAAEFIWHGILRR